MVRAEENRLPHGNALRKADAGKNVIIVQFLKAKKRTGRTVAAFRAGDQVFPF